jgi:acetyl-CoA C-acetyltransferase
LGILKTVPPDQQPVYDAFTRAATRVQPPSLYPNLNMGITPGNASGMNDGASAVVVMGEAKATELGATPLVRVLQHSVTGLDPRVMGLGPVTAIRSVLKQGNIALEDIDLLHVVSLKFI